MDVTYKVLVGDCIEQMRTLPDESVHMIATSPPYWGLRDYGCDGQIGLEQTPEEFVARLVDVFREARRVLRSDGVCWVNLGDSYASAWSCNRRNVVGNGSPGEECIRANKISGSLKEKDLVGIPWRVAFALQADGWWLRQDVIWSKPNPMPESVNDRCTKAHEYVFLLAKSARYFYDAEAVKEISEGRELFGNCRAKGDCDERRDNANRNMTPTTSRNRRSVWTIATAPYKEAHFATWPPKLVEPMIRAGTSERGCCAACGAQWVRVVDGPRYEHKTGTRFVDESRGDKTRKISGKTFNEIAAKRKTTGWHPSCQCNAGETVPCTVLDPFCGSGTTLGVANALGRNGIACELNPEYAALMPARVRSIVDAYYGRESAPSIEPGEGQLSLFE